MSSLFQPQRTSAKRLAGLLVTSCAAFLLLLATFWVGFLGSDDALYWMGAGGWLHTFPYVGDSHWALRHTLVVPMALTRLMFGDGMTAMVTPVIMYALGALVVVGIWIGRNAGVLPAAAALALVATNPQFLLLSSTAYIDIPEIFFLISGLALLYESMIHQGRGSTLFCSGILFGLAMLSRETTALAIVAIALLFLAGFGMTRWRYLIVGCGFALPVGLEFVWLWSATGFLFYRFNIAIHHDSTINRWLPQGAAVPLIHPALDPFVMLLLNHNFALLFWIGPPTVILVLVRNYVDRNDRVLFQLIGAVACVWVLLAAFLWHLLPLTPRYYLFPSTLLAILTGFAFARLWTLGYKRLSSVGMAAMICANLTAVSLDNRHFMWGEHTLVDVAQEMPGQTIHTSPLTLRRGQLLLEWSGVADRVVDSKPAPGDLYYYDPTRTEGDVSVGPGWSVVEKLVPPETLGQWLLRVLIGRQHVPGIVWNNLGAGHPPVTVYRVG